MIPSTEWLADLQAQARHHKLSWLDLLVDVTGLEHSLYASLQQLPQTPQQAWLLEHTPEAGLARQGPLLLRLDCDDPQQWAWLEAQTHSLHQQQRLLFLLSAWPFDTLTRHLRHCTQAEWDQGRQTGLLRYYDPRLILAVCETLSPAQGDWFQATVISWHWIDRDGSARQHPGRPRRTAAELPEPLPPLRLDNAQIAMLLAWTNAEIFRTDHAIAPHDYGLSRREALIRHLMHGQLAADRTGHSDLSRDDFILSWLANQSPNKGEPI